MSMKRSIVHAVFFSLCVIKIDRGTDGVGRISFVSLKNVFCVFKTVKNIRETLANNITFPLCIVIWENKSKCIDGEVLTLPMSVAA